MPTVFDPFRFVQALDLRYCIYPTEIPTGVQMLPHYSISHSVMFQGMKRRKEGGGVENGGDVLN